MQKNILTFPVVDLHTPKTDIGLTRVHVKMKILVMSPYTAKPSVDLKSGLLNSRACALSHRFIKEESLNLQLNYSSSPLLNPVNYVQTVARIGHKTVL